MFRLIVVSALVAIAAGAAPKVRPIVPMLDGRIVGGEATTIEAFPYQVSLQSHGKHICGGSILAPFSILTAAHCTYGASASSLSIRAGSTNHNSGGQVIQVERIHQHNKYNSRTMDYDVSVLFLCSNLVLGSTVQTIDLLPTGVEFSVGTLAIVSGWGTLSAGDNLSTVLQQVSVPKVSDRSCNQVYGSITPRMTCHGYEEGGKDSCQGDSGGPLVVGETQVGVVSWGRGCASAGYPGVYAKVSNSEIQDYINKWRLMVI